MKIMQEREQGTITLLKQLASLGLCRLGKLTSNPFNLNIFLITGRTRKNSSDTEVFAYHGASVNDNFLLLKTSSIYMLAFYI